MDRLGEKVNKLLQLKDMTQADLARASGLSTSLISGICGGKKDYVSSVTVAKLAKGFSINPGDLIDGMELPEIDGGEKNYSPWVVIGKEFERRGITPDEVKKYVNAARRIKKELDK